MCLSAGGNDAQRNCAAQVTLLSLTLYAAFGGKAAELTGAVESNTTNPKPCKMDTAEKLFGLFVYVVFCSVQPFF